MKYFSVIITLIVFCTLTSCKEKMFLISAVKETTIPGRPTVNQFVQYKLQFEVPQDNLNIQIENVFFPSLNIKKDNMRFDIMEMNSNKIITSITKKGKYLLNIRPNDDVQSQIISSNTEEIIISILQNNSVEEIKVSSFVEKTKRIR